MSDRHQSDRPRHKDLITGGTEVVGVEETDEDGAALKVYIDHRSYNRHVLIYDEDAAIRIRDAWAGRGRVLIPYVPDECVREETNSVAP